MAVTYTTAVKNARMTATLGEIDGGVASGGGTLEIGTTGMAAVLVTFTLTDPAGTVTGDTLNFDFDPDLNASASGNGTASAARIKDSDGTNVITGMTVGTTGTDVVLDSISLTSGQSVTLTLGSIQHA